MSRSVYVQRRCGVRYSPTIIVNEMGRNGITRQGEKEVDELGGEFEGLLGVGVRLDPTDR